MDFLCKEVNGYLMAKLGTPSGAEIQLYNASQLGSENNAATPPASNAFLSLVNIEEDRISKTQENYVRKDNKTVFKKPTVHLNLYLLFSSNTTYPEALKRLAFIIQFFQHRNVFTPLSSPAMPPGIDELILDMHTLSFQDLNNLWGVMGSKYLPSVMYKMRLLSISEELELGEAGLITNIVINDQRIN